MNIWNGEAISNLVKEVSKAAVKATAEAIAAGARKDVAVDTGATRDSIHVRTWEGKNTIGATVKTGAKGKEIAALVQEVGSKNKRAKSFLRKNLNKNKGKLKNSMSGKI
ncbi:MAG: hypothetical protein GY760_14220 [Deltaproteobacteria bacterium]|nr:hypothetical protein [Deltaproteobacteria bacterium]